MKLTVITILSFLLIIFLYSCTKENAETKYKKVVTFCDSISYSLHVKPIIATSCAKAACHDGSNGHGDYRTHDGMKLYIPSFNTHVLVLKDMPKDANLAQEQLNIFDCWLKAGAPNN